MKKKGLLISTIVMVVVLVASLTTATYAWFQVDATTSIDGFTLSVKNNSALNIGLRENYSETWSANDVPSMFVSGGVTPKTSTAGALGAGWTGDAGLGPAIEHSINFAEVSHAVAVTSLTDNAFKAEDLDVDTNVFVMDYVSNSAYTIFRALGEENSSNKMVLSDVAPAVANGYQPESGAAVPADFIHMWLGVSPAKELEPGTNNLYIIVQSTGDSIGLAAAINIAWRKFNPSTGAATAWENVDVFGTKVTQGTGKTNADATITSSTEIPEAVFTAIKNDGELTVNGNNIEGAAMHTIPLTFETPERTSGEASVINIDQVEFIIYINGQDDDCITQAIKTGSIKIGIYFGAQPKSATQPAA